MFCTEISCISSQQTLPVSLAAAANGHRRTKSPPTHSGSSGVGFSRSRSCSMGADQDSDSSGGVGSPRRVESKAPQYRLPPASHHRSSKTPHHGQFKFKILQVQKLHMHALYHIKISGKYQLQWESNCFMLALLDYSCAIYLTATGLMVGPYLYCTVYVEQYGVLILK